MSITEYHAKVSYPVSLPSISDLKVDDQPAKSIVTSMSPSWATLYPQQLTKNSLWLPWFYRLLPFSSLDYWIPRPSGSVQVQHTSRRYWASRQWVSTRSVTRRLIDIGKYSDQARLINASTFRSSDDLYELALQHISDVARDQDIDHVFRKFDLNLLAVPLDSFIHTVAAATCKSLLLVIMTRC